MHRDEQRPRLAGGEDGSRVPAPGLLGKVLTLAAGAVLLVTVFMFSLLVFALVATGVLLVGGRLWWKTRDLRRQMRQQMREGPRSERVIEGEVIREPPRNDSDPG
jgi:hypothetical protein